MQPGLKDMFVKVVLGIPLAGDLAKARCCLLGSGGYAAGEGADIRLHGGVSATFDPASGTGIVHTATGTFPPRDLSDPMDFAAFMAELDVSIMRAAPGFPDSGFTIADEVVHSLHNLNRAVIDSMGTRHPYDGVIPESASFPDREGDWTPIPDTTAFLDRVRGNRQDHRWRSAFEKGEDLPSTIRGDRELAVTVGWYEQVDRWARKGFLDEGQEVWERKGLFWHKISSAPTLKAAALAVSGCGGKPIVGDTPMDTELRLDDGKDFYAARLGFGGTFMLAEVDTADNTITAWAVPYWIKGMFEKDSRDMLAFLENGVITEMATPAPR